MANKVNADHLQKLSATHKNVAASVKASTSKARATTNALKLNERNPVVKAVPARARAVALRVATRTATITTRSTELSKRADYVREQAAKSSGVKAPTKTVAMPTTTASATRARVAATKLSAARKAQTSAPVIKALARKPATKRKTTTRTPPTTPVVQPQTRQPATQRTRPVAPPSTRPKPKLEGELQAEVIVFKKEGFFGIEDKRTVRGVEVESRAGLSGEGQLSATGEWRKAEVVAKLGTRLTAETKATTGFNIGRQRFGLEGSGKVGGILEGEAALTYGPNGASGRVKAEAFAGVKADGEVSWDVWPGVKVLVGIGGRAGAGYEATGEATVTGQKLNFTGEAGATALLGAKVKGGLQVDLPTAGRAVAAAFPALNRYNPWAPPVTVAPRRATGPSPARPPARPASPPRPPTPRPVAPQPAAPRPVPPRPTTLLARVQSSPVGRMATAALTNVQQGFEAAKKTPAGKLAVATYTYLGNFTGLWGKK
jgi:hypothetical protein